MELDVIEQTQIKQTPLLFKHAQQVVDAFQHVQDTVKQQKGAVYITGQSSSESVLAHMRVIRDVIDQFKQREHVRSLSLSLSLFLTLFE